MSIQNTSKFPDRFPFKKRETEWATICPRRTPEFKVHKTKALATTAFSTHRPWADIAIYYLDGDEWVRYLSYENGDNCEVCGGPMFELTAWNSKRYARYIKRGDGPAYEQPVVCRGCY